jgi:hypothetical protein
MKIEAPALNETCAVCQSANRAALLSMKELGRTVEQIADAGGFDSATVLRHFEHISNEDDDTAKTLRDSEELYFAATLAGNLSAASSALSVRQRIIAEKNRTKATERKSTSSLGTADPRDPQTWPPELAAFIQAHFDSIIERVADYKATA